MNTEPPTPSERALFAAHLFILATIGAGIGSLMVSAVLLTKDTYTADAIIKPSLVDDLAFCAQVFLACAALAAVVHVVLKRCGR